MASSLARIAITTGDPDGVGFEVAAKALNSIGPKARVQFVVYRDLKQATHPSMPKIRGFKVNVVSHAAQVHDLPHDPKTLIEIRTARPAPLWVEDAARFCQQGRWQGLVTAPLSKTLIRESGLIDIGHTEILSRVARAPDVFMGFLGKKFSVVLATAHLPLRDAIAALNLARLKQAVEAARQLRSWLAPRPSKRPIAIVGLNPHAGESGLLGQEEGWMRVLIDKIQSQHKDVVGPLVPDAAFLPTQWPKHSVYVCPYHDQGLIPFKMIHGFDRGVHITLGLPFVRTSVDHGTAKELFAQDKAQYGSMKEALLLAIKLVKENAREK